ncbi:hypothetical protein GQ55_6G065500 [Panicum hallii var. hallii]|uniref:Uncharacterized protein n=1 Tax=Panicum hallii var. hallii TaxID=1504633 RepID=A0A2T7D4R2_9POAL|nr:hypothetical protein GQ55_6G065500 [Panicum hallii var. hallii]
MPERTTCIMIFRPKRTKEFRNSGDWHKYYIFIIFLARSRCNARTYSLARLLHYKKEISERVEGPYCGTATTPTNFITNLLGSFDKAERSIKSNFTDKCFLLLFPRTSQLLTAGSVELAHYCKSAIPLYVCLVVLFEGLFGLKSDSTIFCHNLTGFQKCSGYLP